jgi:hypothetical protein
MSTLSKSKSQRGCVPYGYRRNDAGRVELDPWEQTIITSIMAMVRRHMSLAAIAAQLQHDGIPTRTGGESEWRQTTVANIVARERTRHRNRSDLPQVEPAGLL